MEALRSLDDHDVVLGPTHDGGYYLMAVDRPRPALEALVSEALGTSLS